MRIKSFFAYEDLPTSRIKALMEKITVLLPVNGKIKSGCIKNTAGNKSGYFGGHENIT